MKLIGTCDVCHETKFLIKKRDFTIPTGTVVTSKKEMCIPCGNKIRLALQKGHDKTTQTN